LYVSELNENYMIVIVKAVRLEIEIEIGLGFNQSKERKPISSLVNFTLIC